MFATTTLILALKNSPWIRLDLFRLKKNSDDFVTFNDEQEF